MPAIPPFTPTSKGFVMAQAIPGGKFVVESWWLNPNPSDSDHPYFQPVGHWIAFDADDALALIAEFTDDLARLTHNP
ncbi:hypothetical protein ACWCQQ_38165 [Streptomyces sp. NPDC002143]